MPMLSCPRLAPQAFSLRSDRSGRRRSAMSRLFVFACVAARACAMVSRCQATQLQRSREVEALQYPDLGGAM